MITCPITSIKIPNGKRCPNTKCMWNSKHQSVEGGCISSKRFRYDAMDVEVARFKGIKISEVPKIRREGKRKINKILILDSYLAYIETRPRHKIAYAVAPMLEDVFTFATDRYPLNFEGFKWNSYKLAVAIQKSVFNKFKKEKGIAETYNLETIMGITSTALKKLRKAYKREANKLKQAKTGD